MNTKPTVARVVRVAAIPPDERAHENDADVVIVLRTRRELLSDVNEVYQWVRLERARGTDFQT